MNLSPARDYCIDNYKDLVRTTSLVQKIWDIWKLRNKVESAD